MKLENIRSQQIPSGKPDPYSALDIEADHVYIHDILANILAEPFLGCGLMSFSTAGLLKFHVRAATSYGYAPSSLKGRRDDESPAGC